MSNHSVGHRIAAAIFTICAITLGIVGWRHFTKPDTGSNREVTHQMLRSGTELVVVYVGSTSCKASLEPGFADVVHSINDKVRAAAKRDGKLFSSVGVALDWSTNQGASYLTQFGDFDEISVGRNWLNGSVVNFVWRDHPGPAATPMIVVFERDVVMDNEAIKVSQERILKRVVGGDEIRAWLRLNAPLPNLSIPSA